MRQQGIVRRVFRDRGFGFIQAGTTSYFFHAKFLQDGDFEGLNEGDMVNFTPEQDQKGLRASSVSRVVA